MRRAFFVAMSFVVATAVSIAQEAPLPWSRSVDGLPGDLPPQPVYSVTGHVGVSWDVTAAGPSGQFAITDVPAGAKVVRAFFITGIWFDVGGGNRSMNFTFAGQPHGVIPASTIDPGAGAPLDLGSFLVDVTAQVTGNATYPFLASPQAVGTGSFGHLLLVIYDVASAPQRKVTLAFGGDSLQYASSESVIPGFQAGDAMLQVFTEADQTGGSSGEESIRVDGSIVAGGPNSDLFCNNQAWATSFFELPVTLATTSPRIGVVTGEDWFGWHALVLIQSTDGSLCPRLDIAPHSLPNATVGVAYSQLLTASGGTPPYVFSATTLPPGLALGQGGRLIGWPSLAGRYSFVVKVHDARNCQGSRSYDLLVSPGRL